MILKPNSIKEIGLVFKLKWSRKFISKDRTNCIALRSKCRICKPTEVCKTETRLCKCTWLPIDPADAYFCPKFNSRHCLQQAHGHRFTAIMVDFKFCSPLFTEVFCVKRTQKKQHKQSSLDPITSSNTLTVNCKYDDVDQTSLGPVVAKQIDWGS